MRSRVMLSMDDAALRRWRGVDDWCACVVVRGEATRGAVRANMCAMCVMRMGRAGRERVRRARRRVAMMIGKISTDKKAKCPNDPRRRRVRRTLRGSRRDACACALVMTT